MRALLLAGLILMGSATPFDIPLRNTATAPTARGSARLQYAASPFGVAATADGRASYDVRFELSGLPEAASLGQYTAYVAWMAASRLTGFACAVPYYGGGMIEAIGEQPRCPVMMHFGEHDAVLPVEGIERLRKAHPEHQVFLYDAGHGFNCDQRGSYNAAAAKLARERTLEFFRKQIG